MKILVTSDTHGIYDSISDYILMHDDIDLLIHAGDGIDDCKYINYETGIDYYAVKGNNDYISNESYEKVIEIEGRKIFLTHGHKQYVSFGYNNIIESALENECDIAIFGHTHKFLNTTKSNILLLNPGSVSLPRGDNPSFIILEINDKIKVRKITLSEADI